MDYKPPDIDEQRAAQLGATLGAEMFARRFRLAADVSQIAIAVFSHPSEPRPTRLMGELHHYLEQAASGELTATDLPRHLWPYVGAGEEIDLKPLLESPEHLAKTFQAAIDDFATDAELLASRKGGRFRDPRLDRFAVWLAQIYWRYMGQRPTYTAEKETGNIISPFGLFAYEAFSQFCPIEPLPEGSVRTAIQFAAWFERESEEMTVEELEIFLPDPSRSDPS